MFRLGTIRVRTVQDPRTNWNTVKNVLITNQKRTVEVAPSFRGRNLLMHIVFHSFNLRVSTSASLNDDESIKYSSYLLVQLRVLARKLSYKRTVVCVKEPINGILARAVLLLSKYTTLNNDYNNNIDYVYVKRLTRVGRMRNVGRSSEFPKEKAKSQRNVLCRADSRQYIRAEHLEWLQGVLGRTGTHARRTRNCFVYTKPKTHFER